MKTQIMDQQLTNLDQKINSLQRNLDLHIKDTDAEIKDIQSFRIELATAKQQIDEMRKQLDRFKSQVHEQVVEAVQPLIAEIGSLKEALQGKRIVVKHQTFPEWVKSWFVRS